MKSDGFLHSNHAKKSICKQLSKWRVHLSKIFNALPTFDVIFLLKCCSSANEIRALCPKVQPSVGNCFFNSFFGTSQNDFLFFGRDKLFCPSTIFTRESGAALRIMPVPETVNVKILLKTNNQKPRLAVVNFSVFGV